MIYGNVYIDGHSNNSLFAEDDSVHRYNPTTTPRLLRQAFLAQGIEINTPDVNQGRRITFDLHFEGRQVVASDSPTFLIALENPNINTLNADPEYCLNFTKVFAWDRRLFKLPNIVPILIPHPMVHNGFPEFVDRDIFSCLINANKAFKEKLSSDLYLERIHTIRWYEKNAPDKFELFGMGWDKSTPAFNFIGRVKRSLSRARTRVFGHKPFPSYRGEIKDKGEILRRCKFSYCYENSRDLPNYITEKMLDSLVSGCVPIYWGADNVLEYIPADCFIDRRKFKDTSEVNNYLLSLSKVDYANYQINISQFLKSDMAKKFSSEYFVSVVVDQIMHDLKDAGQV